MSEDCCSGLDDARPFAFSNLGLSSALEVSNLISLDVDDSRLFSLMGLVYSKGVVRRRYPPPFPTLVSKLYSYTS